MQNDTPTISAVIPLYNGAPFIEAALSSIFAQILPPDEIIVVDDGSTDDGVAVVERLASQHPITLLRQSNGGQSAARNAGIAHARGTLIALLDQDDIWYPHHLAELVEPFRERRYPELGFVYSNLDEIDIEGKMVGRDCLRNAQNVVHPKRNLIDCLKTDMFILPTSTLMRKSAFDAVGGFDERLSGFEDDDLFLRIFRAGYDNIFIDRALAQWRIFDTSSSFSARMARSRMIYLRKLLDEYPDAPVRGRYYTRDLIVPRFFPWLVREYTMALQAGRQEALQSAVTDLRFIMPMQQPRVRALMRILLPLLGTPPLARILYPAVAAIRPALRRLLR